ncbi:MAG: hypothetical protein K6G03_01565 [Lachnospiraceae bacterium]|nr:hypothetical protein [Lachnospiraceae bacterium]
MCEHKVLPGVCIAATKSGAGKTMFTCGLIRALSDRGSTVQSFKAGPDYIDPLFHDQVLGDQGYTSGKDIINRNGKKDPEGKAEPDRKKYPDGFEYSLHKCENLDSFFLEKNQLRDLYERCSNDADISVVEGVMGLYDGIFPPDINNLQIHSHSENNEEISRKSEDRPENDLVDIMVEGDPGGLRLDAIRGSVYEIASILDIPIILVVDAKGAAMSLIAGIRGFKYYDTSDLIKGVVFNRCSKGVFEKLKEPVIKELGIRALGFIPVLEDIKIESRYLGLSLPGEIVDIKHKIGLIAKTIDKNVDIGGILEISCCKG